MSDVILMATILVSFVALALLVRALGPIADPAAGGDLETEAEPADQSGARDETDDQFTAGGHVTTGGQR